MLAETIPDIASLLKEEAGVKWYIEKRGKRGIDAIHYMQFEGRILAGGWAGPSCVFRALVSMSPEERIRPCTHDAYMGAINARLRLLHGRA